MCFNGVLGENIINTLSGSCFVDKMDICLHLYPQTINIKWLYVNMSEISELYGHGLTMLCRLAMHTVYTVYTNKFTWSIEA